MQNLATIDHYIQIILIQTSIKEINIYIINLLFIFIVTMKSYLGGFQISMI